MSDRELLLNLSSWLERRAEQIGPYADHIIHAVRAYEAEILSAQERIRYLEARVNRFEREEMGE